MEKEPAKESGTVDRTNGSFGKSREGSLIGSALSKSKDIFTKSTQSAETINPSLSTEDKTTITKESTRGVFIDDAEEKLIQELDCYHGFIPREDVYSLLKQEGQYLLRVTEVEDSEEGRHRRNVVLSTMARSIETTSTSVRHVIVRKIHGKYRIESHNVFTSMKDLVEFYQKVPGLVNSFRILLKYPIKLQPWEYQHSDLKIGKLLGEGAYGEVREAELLLKSGKRISIAIKMAKGNSDLCKEKIREMMSEARIMRSFDHKNIVKLYGVAILEQPLYILLELVDGGSLSDYLTKKKVSVKEKLDICHGSASGLEYIHNMGCLHRDIAARNCLYTQDKIVKIGDFGLAKKELVYKLRTTTKFPVKWLAPETMISAIFSVKTDVYSFGVLLFEIWTNGEEPWSGFSNAEVRRMVCESKVLQLPESCPESFRLFVQQNIFAREPEKRVSMTEIVRFLEPLITGRVREAESQMEDKRLLGKIFRCRIIRTTRK